MMSKARFKRVLQYQNAKGTMRNVRRRLEVETQRRLEKIRISSLYGKNGVKYLGESFIDEHGRVNH